MIGTVSLNEIVVDLMAQPKSFYPSQTQDDVDEEQLDAPVKQEKRFFAKCFSRTKSKEHKQNRPPSPYFVHSGMLRMAKSMGNVGKPVHVAVCEALRQNPGFGKTFLVCKNGRVSQRVHRVDTLWTQSRGRCCGSSGHGTRDCSPLVYLLNLVPYRCGRT